MIWKGDKLIDGVPETLDLLRSKVRPKTTTLSWIPLSFPLKLQCCWLVRRPFQGKRLVFVTNNSTKSRKQYGRKFETLGLSVDEVGRVLNRHSSS